ncbi:MAG: hypothetical protein JW738_04755 [Actinobacteria bacterium]|nr:hypothetical protein [Actinomycetota bacterium]
MIQLSEKIKVCSECGIPRIVGRSFGWRSDGTVSYRLREDLRVVFLNSDLYRSFFNEFEKTYGESIAPVAFTALKKITVKAFEGLHESIPALDLALRMKSLRGVLARRMVANSAILGHAYTEILDYKPGKSAKVMIKNPYNPEMVVAYFLGGVEFIEHRSCEYSVEKHDPDKYVYDVKMSGEDLLTTEGLETSFPSIISGNVQHNYCPKCGIPEAVSDRFVWRLNDGLIIDNATGVRLCVYSTVIRTIMEELAKDRGEEIYSVFMKAQRMKTVEEITLQGLAYGDKPLSGEDLKKAFSNFMSFFTLKGYGNHVRYRLDDLRLEVVVENPFDVYILGGTFQGLYEVLIKRESRIDWYVPKEGVVSYAVEPV